MGAKARKKLARKDAEFQALDGAIFKAWLESDTRRSLVAKANAGRTQQVAKAAQARASAQAAAQRVEDNQRRQHAEYVVKHSTSKEARQSRRPTLTGRHPGSHGDWPVPG